jgi:hypothetical protein
MRALPNELHGQHPVNTMASNQSVPAGFMNVNGLELEVFSDPLPEWAVHPCLVLIDHLSTPLKALHFVMPNHAQRPAGDL